MTPAIRIFVSSYLLSLSACGPKIDTGRNENPQQWPSNGHGNSHSNLPGQDPVKDPSVPNGDQPTNASVACFAAHTTTLSPRLSQICDDRLKTNPSFSKMYEYLCVKGHLSEAMNTPTCGWNGDTTSINRFIHVYEREPESSGNDYRDLHATIVHATVSAQKYVEIVKLAFEDYAKFKARGFQWVAGTKEQTNLSHNTLEEGLSYKFRVDKGEYELGYNGHIQLFKLDENTWMHLNYATGDFVRIKSLEQAVFYHNLPDGTSMIIKLEHKEIYSQGLYRRTWEGAVDMMRDFMQKIWTNANQAKK